MSVPEYGTGPLISFIYAFLAVLIPVMIFAAMVKAWDETLLWWRNLWTFFGPLDEPKNYNYNTYNTADKKTTVKAQPYNSYLTPTVNPKPAILVKPPSALFFGKIDGEVIVEKGKLEERRLTWTQKAAWKLRKERKQALETGMLDETILYDVLPTNTKTNGIN